MNISISRDGVEIGEWTEGEVRDFYKEGRLIATDCFWKEGMSEWDSLGGFINPPPPFPTPQIVQEIPIAVSKPRALQIQSEPMFSKDELRRIAHKQNLLMWSVLAGFAWLFISQIPFVGLPTFIAIVVFQIYALYSLGTCLRIQNIALSCIFLFIPVVSLLVLVRVSGKASKVLKEAGVKIGLMGGNANDIKD
jgi:hypothetical protein